MLGIQSAMEYRSNFLLNMISASFPIFIQFFLWTTIYGGDRKAIINGYSYIQIITYTIMANIVSRLIRTGFEYEVNDDIKNGGLNKFIVKPIDYSCYKFCCFIGQKLVYLLVMVFMILGILTFLTAKFGLHFGIYQIFLFFITLFLAFILNFVIFFSISTSAFWLFEIGFLFEAVRIVIIFLSGGIFPLDIFGKNASVIFSFLPFKYTINFPVEVLNGRLSLALGLQGVLIQIVWIILFALLAKLLWQAGSKRYVAVGG
jgi:ABC-2 type transport system permease protein